MKVEIPANLKGKELVSFLYANKSELIAQKKEMPIKYSDVFVHDPEISTILKKAGVKSGDTEVPAGDMLHVKAIANVFNYMDSQYDVLLPGCCKRTIKDRSGKFVQLHDHIYKLEAKIGEVTSVYTQNISLSDLGIGSTGTTESLIFEFDCYKSYNQQIFNQYSAGKVNQYSIGLQYTAGGIELAIYDPDSEKEMEFWNKYIDQVINKDDAIAAGFMFIISEIKLLENSAVLFGANSATGTISVTGASKSSTTKSVATYPGNENSKHLMHIDKMMRRNNKCIETSDGYDGDNPDTLMACSNMKYNATNSNTHLQQTKDKLMQGKSIELDPSLDIQEHPQFDIKQAIKETKFINLN